MEIIDRLAALFLGTMLVVVSTAGGYYLLLSWKRGRRSVEWPTTEGRITSSRVESDQDRHAVKIQYSFRADGKQFEGDTVTYRGISTDRKTADNYVAKNPENHVVMVHYDPTNPPTSVLETGVDSRTYVLATMVLVILFIVGLAVISGFVF